MFSNSRNYVLSEPHVRVLTLEITLLSGLQVCVLKCMATQSNHQIHIVGGLPVQSVPITTKIVSSNPTHGEVHSIQHYVTGLWFPPPIKQTATIQLKYC